MCGIAGTINFAVDIAQVHACLQHRGPDSQTSKVLNTVQLIHTRLAIVDIIGGAQPMSFDDSLHIIFNGEIYNHQSLRSEFNLQCKSESDTETVLALVALMGMDCLALLDGMFALALYDATSNTLTLARDRAGEKPLYVWQDGVSMMFASELNTLSTLLPLNVRPDAIKYFLSCGVISGSDTPFEQVTEVLPGECWIVDCHDAGITKQRWYDRKSLIACNTHADTRQETEHTLLASLDDQLRQAVSDQLLSSDREVGAFLSGGIDSGLVTAMAVKTLGETRKLSTFTVSFDGQFDESALAATVARRYGTRHQVLQVDFGNLAQDVETIVNNYGEPICDDSVIPSWYVCQAAREHVPVILTGDGADEQFGGYRRYVPYAIFNLFTPSAEDDSEAGSWWKSLPTPKRKQGLYNYGYRLVQLLSSDGLQRYISATTQIDGSFLKHPQFPPDLLKCHADVAHLDISHLQRLMLMDFTTLLSGTLLPKIDIAAMSHSLETRSPFLSARILAFSKTLPDKYRIRGTTTKYLLRKLAEQYLPAQVCSAPKRGFETPLAKWVDGLLREPIHDLLQPDNACIRDYCQPGAVDSLLNASAKLAPQQRARWLWAMYTTELWLRQHGCVEGSI